MNAPEFNIAGFRDALDRARKARGLNWRQVSGQTGVSRTTLSRMQTTGRKPDAASLAALSEWAGINPIKYLVKEDAK